MPKLRQGSLPNPDEARAQERELRGMEENAQLPRLHCPAAPGDGERVSTAVYHLILALRALGRTTVNSWEIAQALDLPLQDVHEAIAHLRAGEIEIKIEAR